jgi:hypothetical protein
VPNDSVVSFGSVNAIPLQSVQFEALHSDLTSSRPAFETFVRPLLRKSAGQFLAAADPQSPFASPSRLNFTRVYTGHVEPATSDVLTINIEPDLAVASFALYDPTRTVTVNVQGASGNTIELSPQTNGFIRVEDPSSMIYLGYGFSNPNPGPWKVTVSATGATPSGGADFAVSVYFVGGPILEAESSTFIPSPGESVLFSASLLQDGQPLEITQGTAVVRHPDGSVEDLEFAAGRQISTRWTAQSAGTYGVDVVVTGAGQDGMPIERTAFLALEVQPNPSSGRIITNLALVVCLLLLALGILGFAVVWLLVRVFRRRPRST